MTDTDHPKPWELVPAFTPDRLEKLRAIAWEVQLRVARSVDWKHGENLWVAGCKAYVQRVLAFTLAARAEYADWLWAGFIDGQFVLKVGGIPIRILRPTDDGEVPEKYANPSDAEVRLRDAAYGLFQLPPTDLVWRLEVFTTLKARPTDVVLAQVDHDGRNYNPYSIPAAPVVVVDADSEPTSTTKPRKKAVTLPDAEVRPRKKPADDADELRADGSGA